MKVNTFFILLIFSLNGIAQCDTNRYYYPIFETVYKHSNIKYGEAPVWYIPYFNQDLLMDVYEPIGDLNLKRPLMIWVHPGGFLLGDKEADDMVALCDSFAKRGYVTASIGYRLGFNPLDSESAERAVYRGTQDVRAAIRYFKEFASIFRIDTTSIFLGGSSAGGVASLHVAYLDQQEAPLSIYGDGNLVPDLNELDSSGNYYNHTIELRGIVNMWGALGDSTFINSDEKTPALLIHGTADEVVPFGVGHPFGVFTTPLVHGSRSVSNQLESLSIPHSTLFFEDQDHEPHGTSNGYWDDSLPTPYWDTIFNAINKHYYELLRPNNQLLNGDTVVCQNKVVEYFLSGQTEAVRTCWNVEGGEILHQTDSTIKIQWFTSGTLSFRQFSSVEASSYNKIYSIQVNPQPDATFSYDQIDSIFYFTPNQSGLNYIWDFFDLGTSTLENPSLQINSNGLYPIQLNVSNEFSCSSQFEVEILFLSANVTNNEKNEFEIYPNPFEKTIFFKTQGKSFDFMIYDIKGKLVQQGNNLNLENGNMLEINNLEKGTYFLNITTSEHVSTYILQKK